MKMIALSLIVKVGCRRIWMERMVEWIGARVTKEKKRGKLLKGDKIALKAGPRCKSVREEAQRVMNR